MKKLFLKLVDNITVLSVLAFVFMLIEIVVFIGMSWYFTGEAELRWDFIAHMTGVNYLIAIFILIANSYSGPKK